MDMKEASPILTITGSDSTGGSGVQADIKVISELGGYAVSAITSITVQNTLGIQEIYDVPAEIVSGQIEAIVNDIQPEIMKIGMIRSVEVLNAVTDAILKYLPKAVVYDPIVRSSMGEQLMTADVISQIRRRLLPLCTLVVLKKSDARTMFCQPKGDMEESGSMTDKTADIENSHVILLEDNAFHGSGNKFSSAIAYYLSVGTDAEHAVSLAKAYLSREEKGYISYQSRSNELYNEFTEEVKKHFNKNRDVAFYADCLNVSSRYLAQVTKRIADKTPKNIINDYLLQAIEGELMTNKTIQEIAYIFGFSSQSHFTKFFKKNKNCSPREFRKTIK